MEDLKTDLQTVKDSLNNLSEKINELSVQVNGNPVENLESNDSNSVSENGQEHEQLIDAIQYNNEKIIEIESEINKLEGTISNLDNEIDLKKTKINNIENIFAK